MSWVERYRPGSLGDVSGNENVIRALRSYTSIESMPHLIFHGPPGSGKTSSILAIARQFYGAAAFSSMVLELNASEVREVNTMRNEIQCFSKCSSVTDARDAAGVALTTKLVVLDEADSLTHLSQQALRHLIERSTNLVRFCLCCNYSTKISVGIKSRCTIFRFSAISPLQLRGTLQNVLEREEMELSSRNLDAVIDICRGDARRAINLLQGLSLGMLSGHLSEDLQVYQSCGVPAPSEVANILHSLLNDRFAVAFEKLSLLLSERELSLARVVTALTESIVASDDICADRVRTIIREFANIERALLSEGGADKICIGATVGAFHVNSHLRGEE